MSFVRDMVDKFMSCAACRDHWLQAYKDCWYGVCEVLKHPNQVARARAMVLWLWRAHNAVSLHVLVKHPPHERHAALDRRWPPYRDCPGCWDHGVVLGRRNTSRANTTMDQVLSAGELDSVFDTHH